MNPFFLDTCTDPVILLRMAEMLLGPDLDFYRTSGNVIEGEFTVIQPNALPAPEE